MRCPPHQSILPHRVLIKDALTNSCIVMFRLSSRFTTNTAAHAVQCVRTLAMDSHRGAHAVLGSANLTRMRGITGVLAQSASYSSVPRQMTQQMTLKEIGIMGTALLGKASLLAPGMTDAVSSD